jgi:molybdopterin-guanine dinucleotide biosynthesis protein A
MGEEEMKNQIINPIILAGGKSSRMGQNKALLMINGKTIIENICQSLMEVGKTIHIVVANLEDHPYRFLTKTYPIVFVQDEYQGKGPLAGIHAGLKAIPAGYGFFIACDMPNFSPVVFNYMTQNIKESKAILFYRQPLFAIYHKELETIAQNLLEAEKLKLSSFIELIDPKILEIDHEDTFVNLNTYQEYINFLKS